MKIQILGEWYFVDNGELVRQDGTITKISNEIRALENILNFLYQLDGWKETRTGIVRWSDNG